MLESLYCLDNICLPAQNCAYEDGNLMQKVDSSSYEYEKLKFSEVLSHLFNADEFNVLCTKKVQKIM
jgi:hypothetical protein